MEDQYYDYINHILDFYQSSGVSKRFNNGFFKEANQEEMIMQRLECAGKRRSVDDIHDLPYGVKLN